MIVVRNYQRGSTAVRRNASYLSTYLVVLTVFRLSRGKLTVKDDQYSDDHYCVVGDWGMTQIGLRVTMQGVVRCGRKHDPYPHCQAVVLLVDGW